MARRLILLLIIIANLSTKALLLPYDPTSSVNQANFSTYIRYRLDETHHYRPSLVSFLHRQPEGSQLATTRYYRLVFHCNILPGSLYLRFSTSKPHRTVVLNRQDPSTIFAFRSVGAYSRVQIRNLLSDLWLCMNENGIIVPRSNITIDNLACTFRQNSDGPYSNLVSELYPDQQMTFNTLRLLSMNTVLRRRYIESRDNMAPLFRKELCSRFMFDSQIDKNILNRITANPFLSLRLKNV